VSVGRVIALLAEEGDDISNLEAPKEESAPAPKAETSAATPSSPPASQTPPEPVLEPNTRSHHPTHSKHLIPSVVRLLIEGGVTNAEVIKGTGVRGMLTKGDVLAHLGRASNPFGTYKPPQKETAKAAPAKPEAPTKPLDSDAIRQLIVSGLAARLKLAPYVPTTSFSFDSVIADYLPPARETSASTAPVPPTTKDSTTVYFDGLL